MTLFRSLAATIAGAFLAACAATAPTPARPALPADHPLIGNWRLDVPNTGCHEIYEVRPDATTRVTSAAQEAQTELDLSLKQGASGYYRWSERITSQNGQPDCLGQKVQVGQVATNYVILDADADAFLMCVKADINTCVGPFVRQKGK